MIGSALTDFLTARGDSVVQLGRGSGPSTWDPSSGRLDPDVLSGIDAVVNLNGVGIGDKRWTDDRKRLILSSRVDSTSLLASTMTALERPPSVFVSSSAIGFYGDTGDTIVDESAPPGDDFQSTVCQAWEAAADPARAAGIRVVHPRSGIVLEEGDGALQPLTPLFRLGIGGRLGDGSQWWSWITLRDEVRAIAHLIDTDLSGPVNLVAPNPVTNADFTDALGHELGRPTIIPVPKFALDIRLGRELAASLGYGSVRVRPTKLLESGFTFTSETVAAGLADVFGSGEA